MKKFGISLIIILLIGCTISVEVNKEQAVLRVVNNSSFDIWVKIADGSEIMLNPNQYAEQTWELAGGETMDVDIQYGTVASFHVNATVTIIAGQTVSYDVDNAEGELTLNSESSAEITYEIDDNGENILTPYDSDVWNWDLLEAQQIMTDISYNGYHVFSNEITKTITGGAMSTLVIEPDGGGIKIENDSDFTSITNVYLSPSSDTVWGENDLTGDIDPNSSVHWTVTPGWWDVRVEDSWGSAFEIYDNNINLDDTTIFYYSGFKKSGKSDSNTKEKDNFNFPETNDLIQQND